jgi:hypothetical protein
MLDRLMDIILMVNESVVPCVDSVWPMTRTSSYTVSGQRRRLDGVPLHLDYLSEWIPHRSQLCKRPSPADLLHDGVVSGWP